MHIYLHNLNKICQCYSFFNTIIMSLKTDLITIYLLSKQIEAKKKSEKFRRGCDLACMILKYFVCEG